MKPAWKVLVALLGVQAVLSAAAATLEWTYACGSCRAGGLSLGLIGFAFYMGLFLAGLLAGPTRFLFGALLLGFGVHVVLAVQLLTLRQFCWLCLAAAVLSGILTALAVACDRANLTRLAYLLPWSLLIGLGWGGSTRPVLSAAASVTDSANVRMVVFTQPDCPFCDELELKVLPPLEKEFGPRLSVVFRRASELPGVRRTPTIVLSPGRRDRQARVFEGLPESGALRTAILEMEGQR